MSVLDYLPTEYMRARASEWVGDPRPEERPSEALLRACRAARDAGDRTIGHALWDAWFRARCGEGRPPDALSRFSADPVERFWACTVECPDGHLFWDGPRPGGKPRTRALTGHHDILAQRFIWIHTHGPIAKRWDVWATCGEGNCVNVDHLEAGWQPRGNGMYRDEAILGAIQACALKLGRTPSCDAYMAWRPKSGNNGTLGTPSDTIIIRRLGSWRKAVLAAGLTPAAVQVVTPPEVLIAELRDFAAELGRLPRTEDWQASGRRPSATTLCRRFGSWKRALAAAGLRPDPLTHCSHGHEWAAENTYRDPDGNRQCVTCRRAGQKRRRSQEAA